MPLDTPLHKASHNGDFRQVQTIVEAGEMDINAAGASDRRPLHRAAGGNHEEIVEYLLMKGAAVDESDRSGRTPLHWAAINGHSQSALLLVTKGRANVLSTTDSQMTPLHSSAESGHATVVTVLAENAGERKMEMFDAKEAEGRTASMLAKAEKHKDVLNALKDAGDPNAKSSGGCVIL
mmetsp:Transcript_52040/g.156165  ORF Transcript_52040/g.156165 Transcript_52040/m.156165 type:complete len:179 (-) Transcript_52040:349-885(-)